MIDEKLSEWQWFSSALGNAIFTGFTLQDIWQAVELCNSAEEFDAAIQSLIDLREIKNP